MITKNMTKSAKGHNNIPFFTYPLPSLALPRRPAIFHKLEHEKLCKLVHQTRAGYLGQIRGINAW